MGNGDIITTAVRKEISIELNDNTTQQTPATVEDGP